MNGIFDVLVIGAGAVGCAVARELSAYKLDIGVLEKGCDVAPATSGRNSAVVHAGFNNATGSLMAKLCVEGNRGFEKLCRELDVPFVNTGKVLVAFNDEDIEVLKGLVAKGRANGCTGLSMLSREELYARVPGVGGIAGMESASTSVFDPFLYTVALAENAQKNGAQFLFSSEVVGISRENGVFRVETAGGVFFSRVLVNSAGLYADKISAMAGVEGYRIYPCRGEYLIFEGDSSLLNVPVYPAPRKGIGGLGVHLTVTTEGDILVGPSAEYIGSPADTATTAEIQHKLLTEATALLPGLSGRVPIGAYSGIRAKQAPPEKGGFFDFTVKSEPAVPGLINLIGIESPGLTASLPLAKMVRGLVAEHLSLEAKPDFDPTRKAPPCFRRLSDGERAELIAKDPAWGEIFCRCRNVTKAEIIAAINNPLGAKTLSSIKYRTRAATGRCQSGYCMGKLTDALVNWGGLKPGEVTFRGRGSEIFRGDEE